MSPESILIAQFLIPNGHKTSLNALIALGIPLLTTLYVSTNNVALLGYCLQ